MKVKKALSLVLALVMVFTLIPAQLITSSAVLNENTIFGNNTKIYLDVSEYDSGDPEDYLNGLIDVALNVEINYSQIQADAEAAGLEADNYKTLTIAQQVLRFDPNVLSTISAADDDFGEPNMAAVKAKASAASSGITPGTDWYVEANENLVVKTKPKTTYTKFDFDSASKLCVCGDYIYVRLTAMNLSGYLPASATGTVTHTLGHLYLAKANDTVTYAQIKDAISIPTAQETAQDNAPAAVSGENICFASSKEIANCVVANDAISTDNLPADPVAANYTITFKNGDTQLQSGEVAEGQQPVYDYQTNGTPTKAEDAQYTYTFDGWTDGSDSNLTVYTDDTLPAANADATYYAHFDTTTKQYEVQFITKNEGAEPTVWDQQTLDYGAVPTYQGNTTPSKAEDDNYTYTFAGWAATSGSDVVLDSIPAVTGNATYYAVFTATPKTTAYTIKFVVDKTVALETLQESDVAENTQPVYNGETPTKDEDNYNTYTFDGWTLLGGDDTVYTADTLPVVTGEATYVAHFAETAKKYTITWKDDNGTELKKEELGYGETPTAPAEPSKEATPEYTYTFAGWDSAIEAVTGDKTYTATYNSVRNKYTVTFKNDNGDILQTGEVEYGAVPVYAGATPTKDATAQYTYTFNGWTPEVIAVTGAAEYTAQYTETTNQYAVRFINDDSTGVLQESNWNYGATPTYNGATPTKNGDQQYSYTFAGWTSAGIEYPVGTALPEVTEAVTYTAYYTQSVNKYTVVFKNGNDVLQTEKLDYGTMPEYKGATPTKAADESFTYSFKGWTPVVSTVVDNAEYNAEFDAIPVGVTTVAVRFENADGAELATYQVPVNTAPEYTGGEPGPVNPQPGHSYTWTGWTSAGINYAKDEALPAATADTTYTATWQDDIETYKVYWVVENVTVETDENVPYGTTPEYNGATPTKASTDSTDYTFTGWSPAVDAITAETTYVAQFSESARKYTVKFMNGNTELQSGEVAYGETPVFNGATPTKEATDEFTYTFAGWDPAITTVTGDATYNATFSETRNTYEITFVNEDGTELQKSSFAYGVTPEYTGATPTKDADDQYTYSFKAWSPELAEVTGPATYTATFDSTVNEYMIKFVNGDTMLQESSVPYGETPVFNGETPTKDATAEFTYTFAGWNPAITAVTGEATYNATFNEVTRSYTIKFVNDDGTELQSSSVAYGATPVYSGETPTKDATQEQTFSFAGWGEEIVPVAGDKTYTATYNAATRAYTITFYDEDGTTVLEQKDINYGEKTTYTGPAPTKAADETNTYAFEGWVRTRSGAIKTEDLPNVSGEADYRAQYEATPIDYTVKFVDWDGTPISEKTDYHYGDNVVAPADPSRAATAQYTYTFDGWDPAVADVTGNATYTATYKQELNHYTITLKYKDVDGSEKTDTIDKAYGDALALDDAANVTVGTTKYTFVNWTPEVVSPVVGDATYTAQYEESQITNPVYKVNFKYADDAAQAESKEYADHKQDVEEGAMPIIPTPADFETATMKYEFSGWDKQVVAATGEETYVAQYTETPILPPVTTYEINFRYAETTAQAKNEQLVDHTQTVNEGEMPEVPTPSNFVDGTTTYTFKGWDKEVVAATGDTVYTAVYEVKEDFIPDMSEIEELVEKYNQMVKTGKYNEDDLAAVKKLIDDIYDKYDNNEFTSQDEIDDLALQLRIAEDAVRRLQDTEEKKETKKHSRRTSPATGDNASLVVMTVILISALGLAVVSLKKKRENI